MMTAIGAKQNNLKWYKGNRLEMVSFGAKIQRTERILGSRSIVNENKLDSNVAICKTAVMYLQTNC